MGAAAEVVFPTNAHGVSADRKGCHTVCPEVTPRTERRFLATRRGGYSRGRLGRPISFFAPRPTFASRRDARLSIIPHALYIFYMPRITPVLLALLVLASCSTTRYVGEGEYLLDRVRVEADYSPIPTSELKSYLHQHPNQKIFGLLKWPLYVYDWSSDRGRWSDRLLRRMGEAPVIMDTSLIALSRDELRRYMVNKGFVQAAVDYAIDTSRSRRATVRYRIRSGAPYLIASYRLEPGDDRMDSLLRTEPTPIRVGQRFDRDELEQERQRITSLMRRNGYFAFHRDYIYFSADSSVPERVDLVMRIRPVRIATDSLPIEHPHRLYCIDSVRILVDSRTHLTDSSTLFRTATDTVRIRDVEIRYAAGQHLLRPGVLYRRCFLLPGHLFNERDAERTYSSLAGLGALRHVSLRYEETTDNPSDTVRLQTTIITAAAPPQGFGLELEGTNSGGDLGFASAVSYRHRNLLRGSELLSTRVRGAYEALSGGDRRSGWGNYWEFETEASIHFPTFLLPFASYAFRRRMRATTEFKISYDQQRRPEYRRAIISGGWNYNWQTGASNHPARHTLKLIDVDYIYMLHVDTAFRSRLPELTAKYNYSDMFIVSSGYTYSLNSYDPMRRNRSAHSLRAAIELAGNALYGLSHLLGASRGADGSYKLFGTTYSQFVKADIDYARSVVLDARNSVAFHIGGGLGVPYGNSTEIPFVRRYYAGGANNNRGWSVRTLGPGSMADEESTSFTNQVGDIRLDANIEYRTRLFWKFELAAYIDAGNIWTIRRYGYQPDGDFRLSRFYREIALSYGLGLRLDFDYFLIRFDTGLKAYDPGQRGARRWAISRPNLTNNFAWHFAIGYPF